MQAFVSLYYFARTQLTSIRSGFVVQHVNCSLYTRCATNSWQTGRTTNPQLWYTRSKSTTDRKPTTIPQHLGNVDMYSTTTCSSTNPPQMGIWTSSRRPKDVLYLVTRLVAYWPTNPCGDELLRSHCVQRCLDVTSVAEWPIPKTTERWHHLTSTLISVQVELVLNCIAKPTCKQTFILHLSQRVTGLTVDYKKSHVTKQ